MPRKFTIDTCIKYTGKTVKELKKMCKKRGIKARSTWKKANYVRALANRRALPRAERAKMKPKKKKTTQPAKKPKKASSAKKKTTQPANARRRALLAQQRARFS